MKQPSVVILKQRPPWMPVDLWDRVAGRKINFRFSRPERKIYRKREKVPASDWAVRHRVITRGEYAKTKFKKETVPYAAGIMDASFHPSVEEVVMCAADQVSKSFIVETCIGYIIDRDPGPVLSVYPDENTSKENVKERYLSMIRQSPRLRSYLTGSKDDETGSRINLQHMQIYAAWASSAIQLANRTIKYLNLDEIDKYPPTAGKREASPIQKAEKRVRTYRFGRKIWKSSTPTIEPGPIWVEINSCQVIFEFRVVCPDCGDMHLMRFKDIKWPEGVRDPEKVLNEDLAHYECPACGSCWTNLKRDAAIRFGRWVAMEKSLDGEKEIEGAGLELFEYLKKYNPRKIGFHIPSWISPFVTISEVAAAFLKGLKDKTALKDFCNSHEAGPWKDYTLERKEDRILLLRDERHMGLVPSGGMVSCLTAGVDTQDNGFYYEIRAWGWGMNLESWQIRFGFVETFEALKEILLNHRYKDVDEREYFVRLAVQDAMGHRTSDVYDFTRLNKGVIPFKGEQRLTQPHTWSKIDVYPGTTKPIPGGIRLLRADSNFFKNQLARKLEINSGDPGAWHLCSEATEEYARQMCAEYQDEKGFWQCPEGRANHLWDCSYLNLVAVDVLGLRFWKKPEEDPQGAEDSGRKVSKGQVVRSKFMTR